jgi:hypothetical protein
LPENGSQVVAKKLDKTISGSPLGLPKETLEQTEINMAM